ncbi:unnamed protein product [Macrosiphum euphorbiae]|uniref:Uncharacterized protein n=1 Tax=Macrosiphum euphorbiae TaxID=13131 RepID=A0AAV0WP87_9HEMI|nr:unnamed protein product [Macrosiphum euphorbiae]
MHDLLEGVCNYDLTGILRLFIIDFKYFSLETLNQRIQYFGYGPTDIRNRPQAISENNLKNKKPLMLKTTASEMWCLTRYLGLLIGDMVPRNSEIWELYIVLNKMLSIATSNSVGPECPFILKNLIDEHHQLYTKLLKTNLKPKHHHLLHYPSIMERVGPLINIWSMRFEAKHKESKVAAQAITSRKNICYTLFLKNQLKVAHRVANSINFDPSALFKVGKTVFISEEELKNISSVLNDVSGYTFISWVNVNGTHYSTNNMCVFISINRETSLPVYGLIKHIYILPDMIPVAICSLFCTNSFDDHYQSYVVNNTKEIVKIKITELPYKKPTSYHIHPDGLLYYIT